MGIADKTKSLKDNRVKVKRTRMGNIKDFHGRRQHGEDILIQAETRNAPESSNITPVTCFPQEPISPCSIFFPLPQQTLKTTISPKLHLVKTKQINKTSVPFEANKFSFDTHMSQWAQDLRKPLATPSTTVEFDMPYCYSEGLYSKVSAESSLKQPLNNIVEQPSELWCQNADRWYDKANLALQYFRHLCEQPSRLPLQTITIKRTIAQLAAEQCALLGTGLYFEMFQNTGVRVGNLVIEHNNKSTMYLVPDHVSTIKPLENSGFQIKSDSSIFTSSWQN